MPCSGACGAYGGGGIFASAFSGLLHAHQRSRGVLCQALSTGSNAPYMLMPLLFKYGTVFLGSMFKFIFGPVSGQVSGLAMWETILLTVAGMMTSVLLFTLIGTEVRRRYMVRARGQLRFTRKNRFLVRIWTRYGLPGVAFFTPVLFSPIVGTILAISFGETPKRIIPAMFISAIFWGVAMTVALHMIGTRMG